MDIMKRFSLFSLLRPYSAREEGELRRRWKLSSQRPPERSHDRGMEERFAVREKKEEGGRKEDGGGGSGRRSFPSFFSPFTFFLLLFFFLLLLRRV